MPNWPELGIDGPQNVGLPPKLEFDLGAGIFGRMEQEPVAREQDDPCAGPSERVLDEEESPVLMPDGVAWNCIPAARVDSDNAARGQMREGGGILTDIENGKFTPSIYKLYTLSAIYHRSFVELLSFFGLRIGDLGRDRASIGIPRTHLLDSAADAELEKVTLPVEFKPDFRLEKTNLLARIVEKWDEIPIGFLQHLDLRKSVYGYIGLQDFTLYPLIRPGSLVQIDANQRKISAERWTTEFDRPVYFVELRNGYVCSWCQVDRGQLSVIPHPHSHLDVRRFDYPSEAEIIGRVTGIAMRIVGEKGPGPVETSGRI